MDFTDGDLGLGWDFEIAIRFNKNKFKTNFVLKLKSLILVALIHKKGFVVEYC